MGMGIFLKRCEIRDGGYVCGWISLDLSSCRCTAISLFYDNDDDHHHHRHHHQQTVHIPIHIHKHTHEIPFNPLLPLSPSPLPSNHQPKRREKRQEILSHRTTNLNIITFYKNAPFTHHHHPNPHPIAPPISLFC